MFIAPQKYIKNTSVDTICIGNYMGLSAIWKKIAQQFMPGVSAIF